MQTPADEGVEVFLSFFLESNTVIHTHFGLEVFLCNCLSVLKMLLSVSQKLKGVDFFTLSVIRELEFHYWVK